ncbi:broad specificity phosphatase PhoE [Zhongshania antarctica]|uniref:Broad specificity phosphatase PhoE n=1 Tax=Zhongshania antarctica TaxID=641702 RepID=A0A840R017_9GAMM|nr:histidine phosphatase family protein [Zhongshania antarctica]MBB5185906.1 broad specificity phosphatase PhoE [Zhongshania antarctica]
MTEVVMVRHGQAAFASDDYDRLTDIGWEQARLLGEYFSAAEAGFDTVFTGTMRRHRETLAGIRDVVAQSSPAIAMPDAQVLPGLNEYDFHSLIAAYLSNVKQKIDHSDPRIFYRTLRLALMAWSRGELSDVTETWANFESRVRGTMTSLAAAKGRVLVVTSGGPVSAVLREALKVDVETMVNLNLQAKNSGITRYFTKGEQFHLNTFNAVPHLAGHQQLISYT